MLLATAYRRTCLEFHPDKKLQGVEDPDEKQQVEDYFKQIQEAYETLSDPVKRREYDSTDEFDDTLPTECDPADFFKVLIVWWWGDREFNNSAVHVEDMSCTTASASIVFKAVGAGYGML